MPMKFTTHYLLESKSRLVRWVHNTRYESVKRAALRYAGPDRTALDYGCGDGHLVRELGPHFGFVAGAEIDARAVFT
jgi:hypothetical protein